MDRYRKTILFVKWPLLGKFKPLLSRQNLNLICIRLVSISRHETKITLETWRYARDLDVRRQGRLR